MAEYSFIAEEWCATRSRETLGATMVFGRPFSYRLGRKDALDEVMASHCGQAKLVAALRGRLAVPGYPLQGMPSPPYYCIVHRSPRWPSSGLHFSKGGGSPSSLNEAG